ncbi:c-type cytochrome [Vulgatibacter sp.]|uniref:c-type cytochrome n=1 Tax=Vulgatibacter sp. TaxID=1971226 RepID=UPI0035675495
MRRSTLSLAAALALAGCDHFRDTPPARQVGDADPERGAKALVAYGCSGCHFVPGIREATSWVAPPLHNYGERAYVAGVVSNNAENLVAWIRDPQAVNPRTAMPNLGVTEQDARNIAAYLYSLHQGRQGPL